MDNTKEIQTILKLLQSGLTVTLSNGDIQIGAVELKNATTDTRANVLAASTASQATDTPLVVALHPSSPLGAGSAIIGKVGIDQTTPGTTNSVAAGGYTTLVQSTVVMTNAGAYATGDYMGTTTTPQSFASAVRVSGGTGIIKSILISDKITNTNVAMELWILDRTFVAPADNAAWDLSDANMLFVQAVIPISTANWYASSAGQVYCDGTLSYPIKSNGTTLFYALVSRGTTPAFTSSDLTITLGILQD